MNSTATRFDDLISEADRAPFAGWDTAGAKTFGLKTFWVDRLELPPEELGATPDGIGTSLVDVVDFVKE